MTPLTADLSDSDLFTATIHRFFKKFIRKLKKKQGLWFQPIPDECLLSPQCDMEESSSQKLVWDGDAKAVQQCLTDIFTSVYTTCDIPENAIFGPCVLSHTSLYDSIAFIALKSTDKRTAPYIFRVRGSVCPAAPLSQCYLVHPRVSVLKELCEISLIQNHGKDHFFLVFAKIFYKLSD